MFEWAFSQGAGGLFQLLIHNAAADAKEKSRLLDEICGPQSPRELRKCVEEWLNSPATAHLLASRDPQAVPQAVLSLQDRLQEIDSPPDASLLVDAARVALLSRAPATPEVLALRRDMKDAANLLHNEIRDIAEGVEQLRRGGVAAGYGPIAAPVFPQFVGVPDRNPHFVGRTDELSGIAARLDGAGGDSGATVIAQATVGLGGIGKTALAVEMCHRERPYRELVRWLVAEDASTLRTQYLRMGPAIGVDVQGLDEADAVARIRGWFETTDQSWLLVFDNVEDPRVLHGLVPVSASSGRGGVLVTSRHQNWSGTGISPLPLGVLDPAEALELLCKVAGRAPDNDAVALVEYLGGLALAIEQAGSYVRERGWSFARYLEMLRTRAGELLARGVVRPGSGTDAAVLTVWDISLAQAARESAGAGALLSTLAYLGADNCPRLLFEPAVAGMEDLLKGGDPLFVDDAITALGRYSLLETHRDSASGEKVAVSVHRLVQEVTRLRHREEDTAEEWCSLAVRLLRAAMPADPTQPEVWPAVAVLEAHLITLASHAEASGYELVTASWLLDLYGIYLQHSGNILTAPSVFERALRIDERMLGAEHPSTLAARANLASSYRSAGRIGEAIDLEEQVVADSERLLGSEHPSTLTARANLAASYWSAGRTGEAIDLEEQVMDNRERLLGAEHPSTLRARANLAASYRSAGRTGEAIDLEEQVLADCERLLGTEHPFTLTARANLGASYWSAGRTGEAIDVLERVVADHERLLGAEHPSTLRARANLGASYWSAGRIGEAIDLLERVVADCERLLGAEHPSTLRARANLAASYQSAGRTGEAIDLLERVVADHERLLGAEHPSTLTARANLAASYDAAGRTGEAIDLEEQVVADCERLLGTEHPFTLRARANLAASYWSAGRTGEAIDVLERVVADHERLLGVEHEESAACRTALERWRSDEA